MKTIKLLIVLFVFSFMSLFVVGCSCTKNKTPDEKSIIEKIMALKVVW